MDTVVKRTATSTRKDFPPEQAQHRHCLFFGGRHSMGIYREGYAESGGELRPKASGWLSYKAGPDDPNAVQKRLLRTNPNSSSTCQADTEKSGNREISVVRPSVVAYYDMLFGCIRACRSLRASPVRPVHPMTPSIPRTLCILLPHGMRCAPLSMHDGAGYHVQHQGRCSHISPAPTCNRSSDNHGDPGVYGFTADTSLHVVVRYVGLVTLHGSDTGP